MRMAIRQFVPEKLYKFTKRAWRKARPAQIVIATFVSSGCKFEFSTRKEKARVRSLADEREFIQLLLAEIREGDVLFDGGSCIGMHALNAALLGAYVVAFEPDPGFRKLLKRNIRINRLSGSVRIEKWAVSNRAGKATLYSDGVNGKSPSLRLIGERRSITVQTDTLDNAVIKGMLPVPDLVKLDIEGAEILALRGMERLLVSEESPRHLFIELHPQILKYYGSSSNECSRILNSMGYEKTFQKPRSDQIHCIYRKRDEFPANQSNKTEKAPGLAAQQLPAPVRDPMNKSFSRSTPC